jgi:hypothetical protein
LLLKCLPKLKYLACQLYFSVYICCSITITFNSPLQTLIHINMPRTKTSFKKVTNFDPLLQDIRTSLGENYVFYKECIVAISRAAVRRQDASAWFEQMERLVEGVDEVAFSHAGVHFLLREMARGEGEILFICLTCRLAILKLYLAPLVNEMPPPPLPHRIRPIPPSTMNPQPPINTPNVSGPAAPDTPLFSPFTFLKLRYPDGVPVQPEQELPAPTALRNPNYDPLFFTEPTFKNDVNAFWGTPEGSDFIPDYGNGTPNPLSASYHEVTALVPRYKPADDDLSIFSEAAERVAAAREKEPKSESERGQLIGAFQYAHNYRLALSDEK